MPEPFRFYEVKWLVSLRQMFGILTTSIHDSSCIVNTCIMQALTDLTVQAQPLRSAVLERLQRLTTDGTPAM